ncbi:MAG: hypothetical protein OXU61_06715, partial [Gammaproteobacteria bacterium]|nr:hypothetical protein [Gammaproteobacteria bacterium]
NGGVGFIRWMPIGFLHRLAGGNPAQIERGTRTFLKTLSAAGIVTANAPQPPESTPERIRAGFNETPNPLMQRQAQREQGAAGGLRQQG